MLGAVKYRIYPNRKQKELISKHFGCTRLVYNHFLDYRQKQFALGIKETYFTMQKQLTILKSKDEYQFLKECNSQSLQMALRQLATAFDHFFAKRAKYPRFKSKKNAKQSFAIPQNIILDNNERKVIIPKFKEGIRTIMYRDLPQNATIKQAFISCVVEQYYISISYETNEPIPNPKVVKNAVGLDMGLESLLIRSDGIIYPNKNS